MNERMKARVGFDTTMTDGTILPAGQQGVVTGFVTDRYGTTARIDFGGVFGILAYDVDEIEIFNGTEWVRVWATDFEFDREDD